MDGLFFKRKVSSSKRFVKSFKVTLYPQVLYEVFSISPFEIRYEDLSICDIWGQDEGELLFEELESMPTADGMIEVFERYFMKQLSKKKLRQPTISTYLMNGHEYSSLKFLSQESGYSERWIQKQYLEVFGESFKHIHTNTRFIKTLRMMNSAVLQGENASKIYLYSL